MEQAQHNTDGKLKILSPKRIFDDSVGQDVLQVHINDEWVDVVEDIFRSWIGLRRINGEDYHGPVYNYGSEKTALPYDGKRTCGCNVCQSTVVAQFKVS